MNHKMNRLFLVMLIVVSVLIAACGHDTKRSALTNKYPAGSVTSEDIAKYLKFDARVADYDDTDAKKLIINVNQSWVASPPGLKERSLNQWYSMWQASKDDTKGLEVEVHHEGTPVAKWTAARGYELVEEKRSEDSSSSS